MKVIHKLSTIYPQGGKHKNIDKSTKTAQKVKLSTIFASLVINYNYVYNYI